MTIVSTFLMRHAVLTFLALTFAISWGSVFLMVGPDGIPVATGQAQLLGVAMLLGPAVAGPLLVALGFGRAGLRDGLSRLLRYRVAIRWYAVALLTAPLSMVAVLLALSLYSQTFLPTVFWSADRASTLLTGIVAGLVVGFCEELGWTGFAVPRLRLRYGVLATGLLVGLPWGAWHFILFWESDSFSGLLPLSLLLARLFSWLTAYRVLMVWVYDRTESLLITMLMHMSLVASIAILEPRLSGGALLAYVLGWAAVLWVAVGALAMTSGGKLTRQSRLGQRG